MVRYYFMSFYPFMYKYSCRYSMFRMFEYFFTRVYDHVSICLYVQLYKFFLSFVYFVQLTVSLDWPMYPSFWWSRINPFHNNRSLSLICICYYSQQLLSSWQLHSTTTAVISEATYRWPVYQPWMPGYYLQMLPESCIIDKLLINKTCLPNIDTK